MTRMFLEDDDNLSDDDFDDAAPQDETEEPERLDDFDEDDDFDENWDADFEPTDKEWYAETLEIKKAAPTFGFASISPTLASAINSLFRRFSPRRKRQNGSAFSPIGASSAAPACSSCPCRTR